MRAGLLKVEDGLRLAGFFNLEITFFQVFDNCALGVHDDRVKYHQARCNADGVGAIGVSYGLRRCKSLCRRCRRGRCGWRYRLRGRRRRLRCCLRLRRRGCHWLLSVQQRQGNTGTHD